jgi:hypothetical protein
MTMRSSYKSWKLNFCSMLIFPLKHLQQVNFACSIYQTTPTWSSWITTLTGLTKMR